MFSLRAPRGRVVLPFVFLWLVASACGGDDAPGRPTGDGAVDAEWLAGRKLAFLRHATDTPLDPVSLTHVIAYLRAHELDPTVEVPTLDEDAWAPRFESMRALNDLRDFHAINLVEILLHYPDHPALPPALVAETEEVLLGFKHWYTEPTPAGLRDSSYYWTENHALTYHVVEYLMGQAYPDETFGSDGRTGEAHRDEARARLETWLVHRLRFGFSEWHSNVYYQKDVAPLLSLVDHADDEELRVMAASVLDLLFLDMALHLQEGAFGATRGRSYKKDKMTSRDEDTFTLTKLLFDDAAVDWPLATDGGGVHLALNADYDPPEVVRRIATSDRVTVDRERMSLPVPESGPRDTVPEAPHGLAYDDPALVDLWWSMNAFVAYPVIVTTAEVMDQHDLWDNPQLAMIADFRDLLGEPETARALAGFWGPMINFALLPEVSSYTWRSPEVMLSTAVDHRKGRFASQVHSWQATFDPDALVFTNHPRTELPRSTVWRDDPQDGGYWTGEATMPRSAQFEHVAVHVYAPGYAAENDPPLDFFGYQRFTHAYVPQDHFDEVELRGNWVFARQGVGYLALYSHRAPEWRVYDPEVYATGGMVKPFDLVAPGGADNVWIVEVGRAADWGGFDAFRDAILAAEVTVTPLGAALPTGESPGYDVEYASPSGHRIAFGWERPLVVDGSERPTGDFPRMDNPWARVPFDGRVIEVRDGDWGVRIDVDRRTREVYGPE